MKTTSTRLLMASTVVVALHAMGCGSDSPGINPAPTGATAPAAPDAGRDAGKDSAPDVAQDAEQEAGPIVREVMQRDPFGKLDPSNMLHDGDFELSGLNSVQYPWLGIEQSYVRTGAACRSGLRCINMPREHYVLGVFVWPDTPFAEVSFYGQPEASTDCEKEGVGVVLMLDAEGQEMRIGPATPEPVDGWCRYEATISVPTDPGYHYWGLLVATRSQATGRVTFDEAAMVGRATGVSARSKVGILPQDRDLVSRAKVRARQLLPPNPPREPKPVRNPTGRAR